MRCPFCHSKRMKVVNSRHCDDNRIYRKRECLKCYQRWTTFERIDHIDVEEQKEEQKNFSRGL